MPRNDMTLSSKIALLDTIKNQPSNTSSRKLAELTGVPKSTISRLRQQEDQLRAEWALCDGKPGTSKRKREGKDPFVEEALDQWYSAVSERGENISGPVLKAKSEELARQLGHYDFKATDGWLSRWKVRHNDKFKKAKCEKREQWTYMKGKFCADDIYNADETGLYYRATPNGSFRFEYDPKTLDRITILCCANMSGTDKRKLLIIGNRPKPRCFKGLRIDCLPVDYQASKIAWMTSEIFQKWLTNWDIELQQKHRKILLLLNNCTVHQVGNLKNIKIEFLPPNTTSLMGMGIIKNLKALYREKIINYINESIEDKLLTKSSTAKEISSKINLLHAIQFLADSWRLIKINTMMNCIVECNLNEQNPENLTIETNISQVPIVNYQEYMSIDENLPCYDEYGDSKDTIVEVILEEDDDTDDDDPPVPVTNQEARKYITCLQRYFMQEGNDGSPLAELNICADFVQLQSKKIKTDS